MEKRDNQPNVRVWIAFALLVVAAGLLSGCGGSRLALTGGSVPIGVSRLQGKVARADDMSRPVADATVTLSTITTSGSTKTDDQGTFGFDRIAAGTYLCSISAPAGRAVSALRVWSYPITIGQDSRVQLMAGMIPTDIDPAEIKSVRVEPGGYTLNVGETVRFNAQALDASGNELGLRGSLMLSGDIGELGVDGTFQATHPGTATLTAWAGDAMTTVQVTVIP